MKPTAPHFSIVRPALLALLAGLLLACPIAAQTPQTEGELVDAVEEIVTKQKKVHFLNGAAVGVDLCGAGMKLAGCDWSQLEVLARLNLYDKIFPIFELGLGEADHEGRELDNHFAVRSPYFRIGGDFNLNKKHNGNRLFAGLRYGFSAYNYDIDSPIPLYDPVWHVSQPLSLHGLSGNAHWGEVVFGLETKLWAIVRLGWDVRFKFRLAQKASSVGDPWYIPGFGKNDDATCWGGSFKLLFDI